MTYNTQYFPISKTYYVANTNKIKEEKFEYNSINQLIRTRTKYYSSPNEQIVGYEYNSNGQLSSQTDPLGLKETYTYNGKGLLSAVQNHKNKKTSFDYDPWGRKIKSTYADGSISTSTASWASSPTMALIVINESSTGQPDTQTYLVLLIVRLEQERNVLMDNIYMSITYMTTKDICPRLHILVKEPRDYGKFIAMIIMTE